LTSVRIAWSHVSDISPLSGKPLESLNLDWNPVEDISALRGMPLTKVSLIATKVSDLRPLEGMKISSLNLSESNVTAIEPLAGMPLEELQMKRWISGYLLRGRRAADISPLRGLPLKRLDIRPRAYYQPDQELLESLPLEYKPDDPENPLRQIAEIKKQEAELLKSVASLSPEERLKVVIEPFPPKQHIQFKPTITDGAITELTMPLQSGYDHHMWRLRAFPRLKKLTLKTHADPRYVDLSPLIDLPIEELHCDVLLEYNLPVLKAMPGLKKINGRPAEEVLE